MSQAGPWPRILNFGCCVYGVVCVIVTSHKVDYNEWVQAKHANLSIVHAIKPGEFAFVREVGVCVCVCVDMSAPEAINYIHVILNPYNVNKCVTFRNVTRQFYTWA